MKNWFILFCCSAIAFLLFGCNKTPQEDESLWVGTYKGMDKNLPNPFLIARKADTLFLINNKNRIIDQGTGFSKAKKGDTIEMQNSKFIMVEKSSSLILYNFNDTIPYPALSFFENADATKNLNLEDFKKTLKTKSFSTIVEAPHFATPNRDLEVEKIFSFTSDSLASINRYYYNGEFVYEEQQRKKVEFFERNGKIFFSENETAENPQMIYQVLDFDDDEFKIKYYVNDDPVEENFSETKEEVETNSTQFSRCREGQPGEYYHDDITFLKGNEYIIRKISENAPEAQGDGYITIHFTLNCKGEMGHLGLEQMDRNYQPTAFDTELVKHIVTEVTQLEDWPQIEPGYFYKDIHAFLMFKINNGKISDLCP